MDKVQAVVISILCGIIASVIAFIISYKLLNSKGNKQHKSSRHNSPSVNKHNKVYRWNFSYRTVSISLLVIFLSLVIPFTFLFNNCLRHEVNGLHTICYTTRYGECYHAVDCGYLHSSSYKTNVYNAKKNGYRDCSRCYVGELDISIKDEYFYSFLISSSICIVAFLVINLPIKNHYKKINYQQSINIYPF